MELCTAQAWPQGPGPASTRAWIDWARRTSLALSQIAGVDAATLERQCVSQCLACRGTHRIKRPGPASARVSISARGADASRRVVEGVGVGVKTVSAFLRRSTADRSTEKVATETRRSTCVSLLALQLLSLLARAHSSSAHLTRPHPPLSPCSANAEPVRRVHLIRPTGVFARLRPV